MVLLGPHLPHAWSSAGSAQALQTATVLQFPPELLEAPAIPELAPLRALADRAGRGLRVDEPARGALAAVLQDLPARSGLAGVAVVMELLDLLARNVDHLVPLASRAAATAGAARDDQDRRVARVLQWVQRHLASELTVEAAARLVHVSPAAFSRFFSREVGKSFTRYVNDVRCGQACLSLRDSDRPVARVAQACGFETLSHFNRQFKLRTGLSPREFRRGA
jgi:AraC-like DNA-binding protein